RVSTFAGTTRGSDVVEAATGATSAVQSAHRLAAAVDVIDDALGGMSGGYRDFGGALSAQARKAEQERAAAVDRLQTRRQHLLSRLERAYLDAEQVRVRLLEVSAALQAPAPGTGDDTGLTAVSANLDQLRRG